MQQTNKKSWKKIATLKGWTERNQVTLRSNWEKKVWNFISSKDSMREIKLNAYFCIQNICSRI